MKPIYHLSEDKKRLEVVTEDGRLYVYNLVTHTDLEYAERAMRQGEDTE